MYASGKQNHRIVTIGVQVHTPALPIHVSRDTNCMSRIWLNRLGVAAGSAITLATLWLFPVSAAPAVVVLRA